MQIIEITESGDTDQRGTECLDDAISRTPGGHMSEHVSLFRKQVSYHTGSTHQVIKVTEYIDTTSAELKDRHTKRPHEGPCKVIYL